MTGDKTSDRTIVSICFILVKYIISNDNSYNKYRFNTHNIKKILKVVGKQTVTHKIDLIKIEHCSTKRKLKT